jgi:ribosomal protein S18 acetylase RimI-like enzyme
MPAAPDPTEPGEPGLSIRRLGPADEGLLERAGPLFDGQPIPAVSTAFLNEPGHHLLVAMLAGEPVGFVTGVEMLHPDKGREMFLYELGVAEGFRRRGIATRLVEALRRLAKEHRCYGMWVLADTGNAAALATYRRAGGQAVPAGTMVEWRFDSRRAEGSGGPA